MPATKCARASPPTSFFRSWLLRYVRVRTETDSDQRGAALAIRACMRLVDVFFRAFLSARDRACRHRTFLACLKSLFQHAYTAHRLDSAAGVRSAYLLGVHCAWACMRLRRAPQITSNIQLRPRRSSLTHTFTALGILRHNTPSYMHISNYPYILAPRAPGRVRSFLSRGDPLPACACTRACHPCYRR